MCSLAESKWHVLNNQHIAAEKLVFFPSIINFLNQIILQNKPKCLINQWIKKVTREIRKKFDINEKEYKPTKLNGMQLKEFLEGNL